MKKIVLIIAFVFNTAFADQNKISFWDKTQQGANIFNREVLREDIQAAKKYGIDFIRLAPDKFPTQQRDFLIGDADKYVQLVPEDLEALKKILDICAEEKMPVVLAMLSLPGSRWKQHNNDKDDLRLWNEPKYQEQAKKYWRELAVVLKDHPAIVGFNILNEPHPERLYPSSNKPLYEINQAQAQLKLFDFYTAVIGAIRSVDAITPIILDSSSYADPKTFAHFKIQPDPLVIYSFHMYEPFEYTNNKTNQGRYSYPGKIEGKEWNKKALENYLQEVVKFQQTHKIASNRILVGEFGGYRMTKGLPEYFKDLTAIFNDNHWHTAFYAFREDTWDGMDYELGDKKLPWAAWQAIEKREKPVLARDGNSPAFKVLVEALH